MERIAVIGAGIAGLAAARALTQAPGQRRVTVFEAAPQAGGHAHTVDLTLDGLTHPVDTGFLVYNDRTYPGLIQLFADIGVASTEADMSFSVQDAASGLEWCGSNLDSVFAQRRNLLRPAFWHMLAEVLRFNRLCTALAEGGQDQALQQSLGDFLDHHRFGAGFRHGYLLPMVGCIWSCSPARMLDFPVATLIRFCHNHGLLQVTNRPQWRSVRGGSRQYVRRLLAELPDVRLGTPVQQVLRHESGVLITTELGVQPFQQVVFACHTDQALALLGDDATVDERQLLGAIRYQDNRAVLHTDAALLPRRPRAWAAWNYESARGRRGAQDGPTVCLHYLINRLQPLPWSRPVIVSLNPLREPDPAQVHREFHYAHPIFDRAALAAQQRLDELQGWRRSWFCGAWAGYGFHEDGLRAGQTVARALLEREAAPLRGAA